MPRRALSLFLVGLGTLLASAYAEVAVAPGDLTTDRTVILGSITDDPSPVGIDWRPVLGWQPDRVLNADGEARGDGRPDVAWLSSAAPVAVWAYNHSTDHDIVYSAWNGSAWLPTSFLTSGPADDLDPRIFITADDSAHIVWWTAGAVPTVFLQTWSSDGSGWGPTLQVSDGLNGARRPTVAAHAGTVYVAFERSPSQNGQGQDIVVATLADGGDVFDLQIVASTSRLGELGVVLHAERGKLWMEWLHDATSMGCTQSLPPGWSAVLLEPWSDSSWLGIEETRRLIRRQVLQGAADVEGIGSINDPPP